MNETNWLLVAIVHVVSEYHINTAYTDDLQV